MTTSARPAAIAVSGLRKTFGDHVVLGGIDLTVAEGTIFALLGPNGAGKTTTVQILSAIIKADAGQIRVAGHDLATDPGTVRAAIGVTGQFSAVDGLLTGEENLILMADLHHLGKREGRRRAADLLDRFGLADAARKTVATYSGGMRRRLDPRSRRTMWQINRELAASGITILLTTQYLDEADQLADRIALLDHGHLVAEGTPEELKRRIPGGHIQLHFHDLAGLECAATILGGASGGAVSRDGDALILRVPADGTPQSVKTILDKLGQQTLDADSITVHTPDLDDVFFALTGSSRHEQEIPA